MKRILILGGEGMLGHKMFQELNSRFETYVTFKDFKSPALLYPVYKDIKSGFLIEGIDSMHMGTVMAAFAQVKPDVVVNCIGIVKQLKEAKNALVSISINSLFPHQLADLCGVAGARLFHMSTDCVFSGKKGDYHESDAPDPEDLYGRTKLIGEINRPGCFTYRTSIFGRDFSKRSALLEWFLSNRGKQVNGFTNAMYTGFPTQVLAGITGDLIDKYSNLSGLYHISSAPISKYDLLIKIRDAMNLNIEVKPVEDFTCDRSLNASKFLEETDYPIPSWDEMVAQIASDDTPYDKWWEENS